MNDPVYTVKIEQTYQYPKRMKYNPQTDSFVEKDVKSLSYERNVRQPYGWIKESGTPPCEHLDVYVMTQKEYRLGDEDRIRIIGVFRRADGDHKLVGVLEDRDVTDFSELTQGEKEDMHRLYPRENPGEGWFGRECAEEIIREFFSRKKRKTRLLLFDLDGTLLTSDKRITKRTLQALQKCRERGMMIGVSTSRGESNALQFIEELNPDILIVSGGALIKYQGEYIYRAEFSPERTRQMIAAARSVCGTDCEITIDTIDSHYWNYKINPKDQYRSWGDSIYTDFRDFGHSSLKMCVEIFDDRQAEELRELLEDCDCVRFSDGCWYKFTRKGVTKEDAIRKACAACEIGAEEVMAFGDDYADIGMLKLCGRGIAMGNAIDEVKEAADLVIGGNDEDGIAVYLESLMEACGHIDDFCK